MKVSQISVTIKTHNIKTLCRLAIKNAMVADALAMPVHWYYRTSDINRDFPEGINQLYAAPERHPSSIMSLHSKQKGGRQYNRDPETGVTDNVVVDIVGDVILKGKEKFWNLSNVHYHQGMHAGQNTLNAHTVLWLLQAVQMGKYQYDEAEFLNLYITHMTADVPVHPDTYAESYHRGFFANWVKGRPANQCAAVTHDTPSIGGLIRIGPLVLLLANQGHDVVECKAIAAMHLKLTHPDKKLIQVCFQYIDLIFGLIHTNDQSDRIQLVRKHLKQIAGGHFKGRPVEDWADNIVIGGVFSSACYITDSWPAVLFLASKYPDDTRLALQVNAELGGDNVHRGSVLALILTLINESSLDDLFQQLELADEIDDLLSHTFTD